MYAQHSLAMTLAAGALLALGGAAVADGQTSNLSIQQVVPHLSSSFLWWSFDRDPVTGNLVPRRPLIRPLVPLAMPAGVNTTYRFSSQSSERLSEIGQSFSASANGSFDVISAAAEYSQSSHESSAVQDVSFSIFMERRAPNPVTIEWTNPSAWTFTEEALDVLDLPQNERVQAWRERFGRYVALGAEYYAAIEIVVSLHDEQSESARERLLELEADFAGVANLSASFAQAALAAQRDGRFSLELRSVGVDLAGVSIPTASELSTPAGQQQFTQLLFDRLNQGGGPRGLVLVPSIALDRSLSAAADQIEASPVEAAASECMSCMSALGIASDYLTSRPVERFLRDRVLPDGRTIGDALRSTRANVLNAISDVYVLSWEYIVNKERGVPGFAASELNGAVATLASHRFALEGVLQGIGIVKQQLSQSLPALSVEILPGDINYIGFDSRVYVRLTIENAALFTNGADASYEAAVKDLLEATVFTPVVPNGVVRSWDTGSFFYLTIEDATPIVEGPGRGLTHLVVRAVLDTQGTPTRVDFNLRDNLERSNSATHSW